MFRHCIGGVRIRVWNCATLERRHRYDRALPRTRADLQLRATTAAPCRICPASSLRGLHRSSVWWLLRSAIWLLRWPPVLRPPRSLGRSSPSLALTQICVEAAVSAARQVKAMVPVLTVHPLRLRFDFRKSRLLQLLIQRRKIGLQ